jgi:Ca2+-binding RTX toxin-like protein
MTYARTVAVIALSAAVVGGGLAFTLREASAGAHPAAASVSNGILTVSAGNDILDGGDGKDTVFGQAGDDELTSTDHLDALWGSSGKDVLTGGATMHGDDGKDILYPALGAEHWGGTEYDVVDFSAWSSLVYVSLDDNKNDGDASADPDADLPDPMNVHSDIEKIVGTAFDDVIVGSEHGDDIDGGTGNDVIYGQGGNDYLDVEGGKNQRVYGGSGADDTCVGCHITTRDGCEH